MGVQWASGYGKARQVEVIGLSLGAAWQSRGFSHGVTIRSASDLTGAALGELAKQLDRSGKGR
jgi:hypothetical protein